MRLISWRLRRLLRNGSALLMLSTFALVYLYIPNPEVSSGGVHPSAVTGGAPHVQHLPGPRAEEVDFSSVQLCGQGWQQRQRQLNKLAREQGGQDVIVLKSPGKELGLAQVLEQLVGAFKLAVQCDKPLFAEWPDVPLTGVLAFPNIDWYTVPADLCKKNRCRHVPVELAMQQVSTQCARKSSAGATTSTYTAPVEEYLFGCYIQYLVAPGPDTRNAYRAAFADIEHKENDRRPAPLRIGVHLRLGDGAFDDVKHPDPARLAAAKLDTNFLGEAFDCAKQLEGKWRGIGGGNGQPLWLVASDTMHARSYAIDKFSGVGVKRTVLSPIGARTVLHTGMVAAAGAPKVALNRALADAFGEWWLLGECDFIVSANGKYLHQQSAFAATAAMRTFRRGGKSFFSLHKDKGGYTVGANGKVFVKCNAESAHNPLPSCNDGADDMRCSSLMADKAFKKNAPGNAALVAAAVAVAAAKSDKGTKHPTRWAGENWVKAKKPNIFKPVSAAALADGDDNDFIQDLKAMKAYSKNNLIIFSSVNWGFRDMASNWLCSLERLDIKNYVLFAQDEKAYQFFKERRKNVIKDTTVMKLEALAVDYGTQRYQLLIHSRTKMVSRMLSAGLDVLLADNDAWWFDVPWKHFDSGQGRCWLGGSPCPFTKDFDVHIQQDASAHGRVTGKAQLCGGFVYLRSNLRVKTFWATIVKRHAALLQKKGGVNFEYQTEQLLINNYLYRERGNKVRVEGLPDATFPSGAQYYWEKTQLSKEAVVVHNNWIKGKDSKIKRFKQAKLWKIDDVYRCQP